MHKESPTGIDMVLQKLIDPTIIPDPLNIPESLANLKRPRNKRKNKETRESFKPQHHLPRKSLENQNSLRTRMKKNLWSLNQATRLKKNHQNNIIIFYNKSLKNWNFLWTKLKKMW